VPCVLGATSGGGGGPGRAGEGGPTKPQEPAAKTTKTAANTAKMVLFPRSTGRVSQALRLACLPHLGDPGARVVERRENGSKRLRRARPAAAPGRRSAASGRRSRGAPRRSSV